MEPFTCTHCDMGSVPLASLGLQSNFSLVAAASATRQAVGTASWWGISVLGIKDRDCKRSVYTTNPRKLYSKYTGDLEWGLWLQTSCIHQWWLAPTQENSIQNIQGIWNEIEGKKYLHLFIYINNVALHIMTHTGENQVLIYNFTYHDAHWGKTLSDAANMANLLSMIFVCFLRMWQRFFCKLKIHLMMHTGEILPYRNLMNVTNVTSLLSMFFCENYWKQNLYKWNLMNVANVFDKVFPQ